jgi:two-component sensor histidine kinase/CheY-like chemotaxis protein
MLDLEMCTNLDDALVLVVDDNPNNLEILTRTLNRNNIQVAVAIDGVSALEQIQYHQPELILLDVMMPQIDGFEICRQLQQDSTTQDIPIIFMTALSDVEYKVKAFNLGAVDYITKPFQQAEVLARVKTQLKLRELHKKINQQNTALKNEIVEKQKAETSLLKLNNDLILTNAELKMEVEERQIVTFNLQQEIAERQQTEIKLQQSLVQKELLLKEIHHRVKNNLFVASSLVGFPISYINNLEITKILENTQDRIKSMALIHEHLYSTSDLEKIDFNQYIQNLTRQIWYSHNCHNKNINLVLDIDSALINIETATPCGLIINELISNSLEHGFCDRSQGNVCLIFKQDDSGKFTLIIQDDGCGFPEGKNLYDLDSLGLELVCTLVEQIEGNIQLETNNGTKISITFNELNYSKRI